MSDSNTEVGAQNATAALSRFYEALGAYWQQGDARGGARFDSLGATLHLDVALHQSPDLPWGGDFYGRSGY